MGRIPDKQGVFFELDGVVVKEARLDDEGAVPYLDGALEALSRIDSRRFSLFVATARQDIAFGELRERDFKKFCERFLADAEAASIRIAKIYSCPYHPKGKARFRKESVFRKPAPGIFKMAQQEFDLNLNRCWMIGHTTIDMLAASRAAVGTVLVKTGKGGSDGQFLIEPHFTEDDIQTAVQRINMFEAALRV